MIFALIAASLASVQPAPMPVHDVRARPAAPCQAVPALCLTTKDAQGPRLDETPGARVSAKMDAYTFNARPCRLIGNMDCPRRASRKILTLGEPIRETLSRSFGLR